MGGNFAIAKFPPMLFTLDEAQSAEGSWRMKIGLWMLRVTMVV